MSFKIEKHKCPFCNRNHKFTVSNDVPVQKFDLHCNTVEVETRVIKCDKNTTVRAWDWTLNNNRK